MTRVNRSSGWLLVIALAGVAGCDSDAVLLPLDYNANQVTHVHVKVGVDTGQTVRSMAGVQGGPVPVVAGDVALHTLFKDAGVSLVRMPDGYLCDTALSGVFPKATAPAEDPNSYEFSALDEIFTGVAASGFAPERVVYQAQYDVGGECTVDAAGHHSGSRPKDIQQWSSVVTNVVRHLNADLLNAGDPMDAAFLGGAVAANVRAVEFIGDPLGRGGYENMDDVVSDFGVWAAALKDAFPNEEGVPVIQVVSPTMAVDSSANLTSHDIASFLDGVLSLNDAKDLDVLSFSYWGSDAAEAGSIATKLRSLLDERGLERVELWAGGYQPAGSLTAKEAATVSFWSARTGALSNAFWIEWQSTVDAAILERGDRRWLCEGAGCDVLDVEESALWTGGAEWRSAGVGWIPWRYLAGHPRVEAVASGADKENPLSVLAIKDRSTCDTAELACGRVFVLIVQPGSPAQEVPTSILIKVSGLDSFASASGKIRVDRLSVNTKTTGPSLTNSQVYSLVDGELIWPMDSSSPMTEFLTLERHDP